MKLLTLIAAAALALSFSLLEVSEEVVAAIRQGKASELVKYFDQKVSVKIVTQEDLLSRSQAEANLRYFFEKHPVKEFSAVHTSAVNNNAQYITGTLETANGKYRVSVLIRRNLVSQFRIENANE